MREANEIMERRSSQIYTSYKEARRMFEAQAEEGSKQIEAAWKEQGKSFGICGDRSNWLLRRNCRMKI